MDLCLSLIVAITEFNVSNCICFLNDYISKGVDLHLFAGCVLIGILLVGTLVVLH